MFTIDLLLIQFHLTQMRKPSFYTWFKKGGSVQSYGIISRKENKGTHLGCCNSLGVNPLFIDS